MNSLKILLLVMLIDNGIGLAVTLVRHEPSLMRIRPLPPVNLQGIHLSETQYQTQLTTRLPRCSILTMLQL